MATSIERVPLAVREKIVERLRAGGVRQKELAREFNLPPRLVSSIASAAGLSRAPRAALTRHRKQRVLDMLRQGMSVAEIAEATGVAERVVRTVRGESPASPERQKKRERALKMLREGERPYLVAKAVGLSRQTVDRVARSAGLIGKSRRPALPLPEPPKKSPAAATKGRAVPNGRRKLTGVTNAVDIMAQQLGFYSAEEHDGASADEYAQILEGINKTRRELLKLRRRILKEKESVEKEK